LARQRETYLARIAGPLAEIGESLLDRPITLAHQAGWDSDRPLLEVLRTDRRRDRRYRATQAGPHRGDVVVQVDGRAAKDHVSRGQQKLVAAALMLAQLEIQEQEKPGRSALLLDDPAAELDGANLARLMSIVQRTPAQLWVTSLRADIDGLPRGARLFHVEQGRITRQ
jgi:DNA replication and repair protein RecF